MKGSRTQKDAEQTSEMKQKGGRDVGGAGGGGGRLVVDCLRSMEKEQLSNQFETRVRFCAS